MLKKVSKKGFTLIELLASIAILAVVLLLVTISYSKIRKNALNKQYQNLKTLIEQVSIRYSSKTGAFNFFVQELIDEGYLEPDDDNNIYDPRDKHPLNCHLVTVNDEDPIKASLHDENHMKNDGTCDPSSISGFSSNLLLNAKLSGTDTVYTSDITVPSSTVYPLIYNGWTKYNIDITPDLTRISEEKDGSRMVWNNNPDLTTYYPNLMHTSNESIIYDDFYYADLYLSNETRYQARLKYKMDNEKPVIYHDKTALAKSTNNDEWVKSRIVIMYVTDKDGVGLDRVYIGPRPCSDLLTDASMGQAAIPGLVQAYNLNGEIPEAGINANVCAVDKLGNLADGGNVFVSKIDSVAPSVTTNVYTYSDSLGDDITSYNVNPLLTVTGDVVDIVNAHPTTNGWNNTGHMYKFSVTDQGAGLLDGNRAVWTYNGSFADYLPHNVLDHITVLGRTSLSSGNTDVFAVSITGKGQRIARFAVCDKLNNCRDVNIIKERIDKDGPTISSMNFVFGDWSVYTTSSWTNKDLYAARSEQNKTPIASDPGSGIISKYQIRDASNDSNQFVDYNYSTSNSLYKMTTNGTYKREFRAMDDVGNYGPAYLVEGKIDKTAPEVKAYIGAMMYKDPNFSSGNNSIKVYNNTGNGHVTHERKTGGTPEGSHYIRITTDAEASPGHGGFSFGNTSSSGKVYLTRIVAKIPVGYDIKWGSNAIGGGSHSWLTPTAGTGDWEEYLCKVDVGTSTSAGFGTTNYFYLSGGSTATTSKPVVWDVAYATVFDTTKYDSKLYLISSAIDNANGSKIDRVSVGKSSTPSYGSPYSAKKTARVRADVILDNATYYVHYKDVAGNEARASASTSYIDRTKPAITIKAYNYDGSRANHAGVTKYNEQTFTDNATIYINNSAWTKGTTFEFYISDNNGGLKSVSWRWDNESKSGSWATSSNGGAEGNVSVSAASHFFEELTASGQRRAIINATDNNGNKTEVIIYVKVDRVAPTCGSASGASTTYTNQNRTISVGCTDDTGGSGCVSNPTSKTFTYEVNQDNIQISDYAGNTRNCSVNVYIDKTPPTVYIDDYQYSATATNNVGTELWLHNSSGTNTYSGVNGYHYYNGISGIDNLPYCITFKVTASDSKSGLDSHLSWWRDTEYYQDQWPIKFKEDTGSISSGTAYYNNFNVKGWREALLIVKDKAGNETKVTVRAKVRAGYSGNNCSGGSAPGGGGSGGNGGNGGTGACPGFRNTCKPLNASLMTPQVASGRNNMTGQCNCPNGYTYADNVGQNPKFGCKNAEETVVLNSVSEVFIRYYKNGTGCAFNGTTYSVTNKPSIWFTDRFSGLSYYKIKCTDTKVATCSGVTYASKCNTDNSGAYGYRFDGGTMVKCPIRTGSEYVATQSSNTQNVAVCCE